MAYTACLTFHDDGGEALSSVRSGRMTQGDAVGLAERLARDHQALVTRQPSLRVAALTDGAPEREPRQANAPRGGTSARPRHRLSHPKRMRPHSQEERGRARHFTG